MTLQPNSVILRGGLNLVTPAMAIPGGMVLNGLNYEADASGYTSLEGYERFDGRLAPSDAEYWSMPVQLSSGVSVGDTVTGATSGASAIVLFDADIAADRLVLAELNGEFEDNEEIKVGASVIGHCRGNAVDNGATNDEDHRTFLKAAIERRRALIQKVPGSGPVRCVFELLGEVYAIRDASDGARGVLHKASVAGWQEVPSKRLLAFTAATNEIVSGDQVTGGTSAATATVLHAVILKDNWGSVGNPSGSGFLIVDQQTGTFVAEDVLSVGGTASVTASGDSEPVGLPAGGVYEVETHNFYGSAGSDRAYLVNGIGSGFEFDGTALVPLKTGLSEELEKPTRVQVFSEHLFLGYETGTVMRSETGTPVQFRTTAGAGEIGFGSPIRALPTAFSTALVIIGKKKISYLTGTSIDDFRLDTINNKAGGYAGTDQLVGELIYMDRAGVRSLSATQKFGNFRSSSVTALIEPWWKAKRKNKVKPVGSLAVSSKDIYRLFLSDGSVLSIYVGSSKAECMHLSYPFRFNCGWGGADEEEEELTLVGAEDGFVYQLDSGNSFDGEPVTGFLKLPYNSFGSPNQNKTFFKATFEISGARQTQLGLVAEFSNGNPDQPHAGEQLFDVTGGGGIWNVSNWNEFLWSTQHVGQADAYIDGNGTNVSATVIFEATEDNPHTLSIATFHYSNRGLAK